MNVFKSIKTNRCEWLSQINHDYFNHALLDAGEEKIANQRHHEEFPAEIEILTCYEWKFLVNKMPFKPAEVMLRFRKKA